MAPNTNPNPNNMISDSPFQIHGQKTNESMVAEASVSDDLSSPNQKPTGLNKRKVSSNRGYVTFNVGTYSTRKLKGLKNRLILELKQVRELFLRIESRESQSRSGHCASQFSGDCGTREIASLDSQAAFSRTDGPKDRPTRKAIQPYRASDFTTGKQKFPAAPEIYKAYGNKRPLPPVSTREPKRWVSESVAGKSNSGLIKTCGQILTKLMKHKHGWIFNVPVDVVGMGLHNYNQIINHPMDLGTVKLKLRTNLYASPLEFAADVRLTFNNALIFNPKGHDVYVMAEMLLALFEEMFIRVYTKSEDEDLRVPPPQNPTAMGRSTPSGKQPKPKAKELNKREMTYEEKQKLGIGLQNLPPEKMDQVVQIIRRRHSDLAQNGDEIEIDIEAVDTETLWELDRLVCNFKKMVSKIKRQALVSNQIDGNKSPKKKSKKGKLGDEDVEIGDEMPLTNFPPVEIEKKDVGHGSGSSSSSSSSSDSSSSSSDSGSSSENEPDDGGDC